MAADRSNTLTKITMSATDDHDVESEGPEVLSSSSDDATAMSESN